MHKYSNTAYSFILLLLGAAFLARGAFADADCILNVLIGLVIGGLGVAGILRDRRLPAYSAFSELQAQVYQLGTESPPAALKSIYDDRLTEARFWLNIAQAKLRNREWSAAVHTVNLGKQHIRQYRDEAAAANTN